MENPIGKEKNVCCCLLCVLGNAPRGGFPIYGAEGVVALALWSSSCRPLFCQVRGGCFPSDRIVSYMAMMFSVGLTACRR